MSIPGVSTLTKISIQNKLDNILDKEFHCACSKFIQNVNNFNDKLFKVFKSEKLYKINAKLSNNIYLKRYPIDKLKHIMNFDTNLSEYEHVINVLYKTFNLNELLILFHNLDYFIKNESIRNLFPKLTKTALDQIYIKNLSENNSFKEINKKLSLTSPLKYDKTLNKQHSSYYIAQNKKKDIILKYNRNIENQRKKIFEKEKANSMINEKIQKTMRKLRFDIDNIQKMVNSRNFHIDHPLVDYHMNKSKSTKNSDNIYRKSLIKQNFLSEAIKSKDKFKKLSVINRDVISKCNMIKGNLSNGNLKEKQLRYQKFKEYLAKHTKMEIFGRNGGFFLNLNLRNNGVDNGNIKQKVDRSKSCDLP